MRRYKVRKLTNDCWLVIDRWTGDTVYTTRTEHKATSWRDVYEGDHHDSPTDEKIARAVFSDEEFEAWLLRTNDDD